MNEKIKAALEASGLLKILGEHASEFGNGTYSNTPYPEVDIFAKLIVRWCAHVCTTVDNTYFTEDISGKLCAETIKQHFGSEP
jgi:hypothetical protein